ncbi:hypothetical protein B0H19DRAFT_220534 [Mycena capillaripes]|nr:hypothetical protein B0H19DRAFT_220534 [Mycena capillaripes]
MFIWSMLLFFVAFSFMCFQQSSFVTRMLVGLLWTAVAAFILWCIFIGWEGFSDADNPADGEEVDASSVGEASGPETLKQRWQWPSILFRKASTDSDQSVV